MDEVAPTPSQVRAVLAKAPLRNRVVCGLMAYSGVRPEVLGNYLGDDGLTLGDFPELDLSGADPKFRKMPALVVVRESISKAGHAYLTFAATPACRAIEDYLKFRLADGEKLTRASDLVTTGRGRRPFLRTMNISEGVRATFRSLGMRDRPYVLRVYFETRLGIAEGQGKVAHRFVVHWGGHMGDITAR
ncbi:integrase/recombinase, partial [mine drainage metagenome]